MGHGEVELYITLGKIPSTLPSIVPTYLSYSRFSDNVDYSMYFSYKRLPNRTLGLLLMLQFKIR